MPPQPKAPLITVQCVNPACSLNGKQQTVQAGVSLSPTVLLTGTLNCTVCGSQLEPLAGPER